MKNKKILMFLAQGFDDLEAATVIDLCGWTYYRDHLQKADVTKAGLHETVAGRFGLKIRTDILVEDVEPQDYDALALPGGFHSHGFDEAYGDKVLDMIRSFHKHEKIIATMCVGILPVAKAGVLKGRKATTYPLSMNHDNPGYLLEFGCEYTGNPMEVDGRIISCAGPSQSLKVVMSMLEMLLEPEQAEQLKEFVVFNR